MRRETRSCGHKRTRAAILLGVSEPILRTHNMCEICWWAPLLQLKPLLLFGGILAIGKVPKAFRTRAEKASLCLVLGDKA